METKPVGSYPPSGLDVLVVGTGLAGLTAAIECIRKGHNVQVLERNASINTAGDMYFMGLSATKFFKHWPAMAKEYDDISLHNAWIETFKHSGAQMIAPLKVSERLKAQGLDPNTPPGTFQMRPLVYKMFVHQVEQLGVRVQFGRRVVEYWEDEARGKAGVVTDRGERFEADVVIAADGVGSKSQKIVGGQVKAISSGRAMWRAAFPIEHLEKNQEVKEFFKMIPGESGMEPIVRTWLGPGTYALTLTRPDTIIWIMNHDVTGSEAESWSNTVEPAEVLEGMDKVPGPDKWAPIFRDLVALTPAKTIINFELLWRNPQPRWASPLARVVQVGDAAHSFLPASGNGATQAIEDAVSLAACLQLAGGPARLPHAVRAHVRMRFVRNACAQKLGFSNAELLQDTDWSKVKLDPRRAAPKLPRWVWSHDPERYACDFFEKFVEAVRKDVPLAEEIEGVEPNYPPGYRYEPWHIEDVMEDMRMGRAVELGSGDWD
ncbi:putative monooxygenase fad-binding protein [Neofusicoccum parvum UCRNP2]|uniref:Putative monooxygenase fad-binding protein n=1 Tax=Botryosphaeria parva (strain UCR-NP2) TaxID=1287680 RepID=R1GF04_BOTPV|nr:putative monooxygenase fad-binding protein [Neofusicoccum parvum UCRNP2]